MQRFASLKLFILETHKKVLNHKEKELFILKTQRKSINWKEFSKINGQNF